MIIKHEKRASGLYNVRASMVLMRLTKVLLTSAQYSPEAKQKMMSSVEEVGS